MKTEVQNSNNSTASNRDGSEFRRSSLSKGLRNLVVGAAVAATTVGAEDTAKGAFTLSIPTFEPNMRSRGLEYEGRIAWVRGVNSLGNVAYTQGLVTGGGRKIITEAHVIPGPTSTYTLVDAGDGSNYLNKPGNIAGVESWVRNTSIDLGVVTLLEPLSFTGSVNFAVPTPNSNYRVVSFGPVADPATPSTVTGDLRAFDMQATGFSVAGFGLSDQDFFHLRSLSTDGRTYAIGGDSSSFLFDTVTGDVVGSSSSAGVEFLIANRYNSPTAISFLNANGVFLPEPTQLATLGALSVIGLKRQRRSQA